MIAAICPFQTAESFPELSESPALTGIFIHYITDSICRVCSRDLSAMTSKRLGRQLLTLLQAHPNDIRI